MTLLHSLHRLVISRANKVYFVSDNYDKRFPTMNISVAPGRAHLTSKTMVSKTVVAEQE